MVRVRSVFVCLLTNPRLVSDKSWINVHHGTKINKTYLLKIKAGVLENKVGVLEIKAGVLEIKTGVLEIKAEVLENKAGVFNERQDSTTFAPSN